MNPIEAINSAIEECMCDSSFVGAEPNRVYITFDVFLKLKFGKKKIRGYKRRLKQFYSMD